MLRLQLVTAITNYGATSCDIFHGTKVLRSLVQPWSFSNRIVCADSYFSSVEYAETLSQNGLHFIGIVKTATKKFPMKRLLECEFKEREDYVSFVHKREGQMKLIALG